MVRAEGELELGPHDLLRLKGVFRKVQRRGHISNEPERREGVQGGERCKWRSRNGLSLDN